MTVPDPRTLNGTVDRPEDDRTEVYVPRVADFNARMPAR